MMTNNRTALPFKLGAGEKDQLEVSKLFLWYGQDFGHDERAVIGWLAANMPTDTQASREAFLIVAVITYKTYRCLPGEALL
jgi:hypothetical protein